ncbi:protein-nucleus import-related protein [Kockovaella imperatae]|uniref:Protein-nucleus import-related protein n=1 Tax=Kockovaella imperatae TaxID=4999 RepID=A0A1Y1ULZ5_9TREE|nr:protein-nucleus import-related protein [Kockovaella imperatae]ORX38547.1 protein-nucleus import-related protein [Kockovaella imperatae]
MALVAFFNSFKLSRRITTFDQLADGKALMEVMSTVDSTHFKSINSRATGAVNSPDNWVLKMNTLKRLHRLLLSYRLPSPHPSSLSLSTLPEPAFSAIAKSPNSPEGRNGLVQLSRMCLSVSVWAPGNEKVISKIQALGEGHMASLMKSIEGIMETFPDGETEDRTAAEEHERAPTPPIASDSQVATDTLLQENDDLRARCEQMMQQVEALSNSLDEMRTERDDALSRSRPDASQAGAGLRNSQMSSSQVDSLRNDLARAEEHLAVTEADLEKQTRTVTELERTVENLKARAAEAARLKDQLDEHRHTAEKLRKSENVVEKYKKKLDESAGLRRDMRVLEEENATLVNRNNALEAESQRAGSSSTLADIYKSQLEASESRVREQDEKINELSVQLESNRAELVELEEAHARDREELQLHQERARELELGAFPMRRDGSRGTLLDEAGNTTLDEEIGAVDVDTPGETKTDLRLRIKALERQIEEQRPTETDSAKLSAIKQLLADANKSRNRYQAEYLEEHRSALRLQATLDKIRSAPGGDAAQSVMALRERLDELSSEKDTLLRDAQAAAVEREETDKKLRAVLTDLSLVDKDKQEQLRALRESVSSEAGESDAQVLALRDQVSSLREKEKTHLEEINRLLSDKIDLQSAGISQREKALDREKEFSDIRAALASSEVSSEVRQKITAIHDRNARLDEEVRRLSAKLEKAENDPLMSPTSGVKSPFSEDGRGDSQTKIDVLKEKLQRARHTNAALERRYRLEQQLMLSAWHELGARTVRDHITAAGVRRVASKPTPTSWLGRQRKHQEDASFTRI